MRLPFFWLLALFLGASSAQAQSILDNLPSPGAESDADGETPASPAKTAPPVLSPEAFTITDVNADVTADTASHARDQALMQAERAAYTQLCGRLGLPDNNAKLDDDAMATLVQSFEVQSEHLSSVRYIGVFTIQFKPAAMQKRLGKAQASATDAARPLPTGPLSHLLIGVQSDSLAAWSQIKRRLNAVPIVAHVETLDLGRGLSHIDLTYGGSIVDLQQALSGQGLVLRQNQVGWELYDGSMVPR